VKADPNLSNGYVRWGDTLAGMGRYEEAAAVYRQGIQRNPQSVSIAQALAWLLATCRDEKVRDGVAAGQLAEQLCKATEYRDPRMLDVLAAAQAAKGDFQGAAATAKKAIELSRASGRNDLVQTISSRLKLYESEKAYRQ
jgi:tetratricopeptide (TPR) repeat protein